jgi:hypothetical protein
MSDKRTLAVCLLTGCAMMSGIASAAAAQTQLTGREVEARALPQAPTPVSERKITQFATAYAAVAEIQLSTAEKLGSVTTPAQMSELRKDAEQQSRAAILRAGLALDEFDAIAKRAEVDGVLRQKITDKLEERTAV